MNTNRDRLDETIDIVAARMTNVEKDAALAARIANSLPERRLGWTWIRAGWAPRLAMLALAALAITVVLRTHHSDRVTPPKPGHQSVSVTPAEPGVVRVGSGDVKPRRVSVGFAFRRTGSRTTIDRPDHQRSLAPIDAPGALSLTALTPSELALEPALVLAPLEIADLPLSSDFSPR